MTATLTSLDAALQTALDTLVTGGFINYGLVLADDVGDSQEVLTRAGQRAPFVLIVYGGGDMKPINVAAGIYEHVPQYEMLIGVKALRSVGSAKTALHSIMPALISAISGKQFSLAIEPCKLGRVRLVSWSKPTMVFSIPLSTRFTWVVATEAA
ncbi:MAG: hypothetical protein WC551_11365 [Patescibacteria group bacterium]